MAWTCFRHSREWLYEQLFNPFVTTFEACFADVKKALHDSHRQKKNFNRKIEIIEKWSENTIESVGWEQNRVSNKMKQ